MSKSPAAYAQQGQQQAWTTVEVDLGATPARRGEFTVTDAVIAPDSVVVMVQAAGPYTGKGTLADEAEMEAVRCWPSAATGSVTVLWQASGYIKGNVKFSYTVAT